MAWSLLLAFFFLWCPGANSEYTLTQPAAQSFPMRQAAKISCTMSRDSQVGGYTIFWYQQKGGERPKYLLYNTGTNGRFTGSKDTSANAAYLSISNLQAEDEADYYCGGAYGGVGNWRFHSDKFICRISPKDQLFIMAWSLLLAFFFLWCPGANSQYTLTQPEAQSFPLGQPAKISCTMSRDSQIGSYGIYWYQQKAGESPKYLLADRNSNGRFTGSKDTSENAAYLTITNLQAEDEADYYCGGGYGSGSNWRYHSDKLTCRRANSQYTLTQPAAQSFPPAQPAKISCTMRQDSQVGSYNISWYQQKAGESPKYLLYETGRNGRFTGSKDTSANAAYLTISNLQAEDEADYYCGSYYSSGGNWW
ncbi:PREDICTED: uncharacterized protein LOC106552097 [Thamnophis sirtalis]|uniref:Uncharacterized protein LOC106552097 n=1 Tax=Thamnophis sirtalis TaxID=35019 RepID=A0A6I9YNB2_9SAUR|nr:PREDICTED: uncharacterized protein LOC106552097 [Thamnophis sirtalis]